MDGSIDRYRIEDLSIRRILEYHDRICGGSAGYTQSFRNIQASNSEQQRAIRKSSEVATRIVTKESETEVLR